MRTIEIMARARHIIIRATDASAASLISDAR
jgi:hypothetical protein